MQLPQIFSAFFGRKQATRALSSGTDAEDFADMQAARMRPLEAPPSMYSSVSAYLANMPIYLRQQVMLALYDTNFYMEHLTNRISHPILGKTGFQPFVEPDAPATQDVLDAFWETDGLTQRTEQARIVRDFLVVGEVFDLVAPCGDTFYTAPLLPAQVHQTVTDPRNYHKLCGVKQEVELGSYVTHPLIVNERTLSPQAVDVREQWRQRGGYDCFFLQNLKKTAPVPGNWLDAEELHQKRGEPFLFTTSDLFKQMVDYLWTSIDRAQSLNTFNWAFGVKVPERLKDQREREAYIRQWQNYVGTPKQNSAFFYPSDDITMTPVSFPSGVASAMEGLFKLMRNTVGWAAASRDEDMGDSDSRFASMKAPGLTNPTVETLMDLQLRVEEFHHQRALYVLNRKADDGLIPRSEYTTKHGRREFKFKISSPEISKQDFATASQTMNLFAQGWSAIAGRGVYTLESLVEGERKMVKELFGLELEVDSEAVERMKTAAQIAPPPDELTESTATGQAPRGGIPATPTPAPPKSP